MGKVMDKAQADKVQGTSIRGTEDNVTDVPYDELK
jgi:hypothetical protein